MAFKPTLFAPEEAGSSYPYLGHPTTEIVLEQPNGEGAVDPSLPDPDDRSRIAENAIGGDVYVNRAKRVEIEFTIDYIDAEKKAEIERLYHDGRDVYVCPNRNQNTRVCLPLMRNIEDTTGRRVMSLSQAGTPSHWDEADQVMRTWGTGEGMFPFHGIWSRYWTSGLGSDNKSPQPAPDSGAHGMTVNTGVVTFTYTEDVLTPILARRGITNGKGILHVQADTTGGICEFRHQSASTISTTSNVTGSILIQFTGFIEFDLRNHGGSVTYDSTIVEGNGRWMLIKLGGANTNATNNTEIGVKFLTSATRRASCLVAGVYLGNDSGSLSGEVRGDDWSQGGIDPGFIIDNDAARNWCTEFTISFAAKYTVGRCGFFELGSGPSIYSRKSGANDLILGLSNAVGGSSTFTLPNMSSYVTPAMSEGDWYVVHFTVGESTKFYINGQPTALNSGAFESYDPGNQLRLGNVFGASYLPSSGMSHFRMDAVAWSAQEVEDHYDTFFAGAGRGIIEPAFGRLGRISEIDFDGARMGSGDEQFVGSLVWTELEVEDDAPMQEQEGDV